jgi:hypothetical protein
MKTQKQVAQKVQDLLWKTNGAYSVDLAISLTEWLSANGATEHRAYGMALLERSKTGSNKGKRGAVYTAEAIKTKTVTRKSLSREALRVLGLCLSHYYRRVEAVKGRAVFGDKGAQRTFEAIKVRKPVRLARIQRPLRAF